VICCAITADYSTGAQSQRSRKATNPANVLLDRSAVGTAAAIADPESRGVLDAAFEAGVVETFMIGPEDVARYYSEGGRPSGGDPHDWLPAYRQQYQEHVREVNRAASLPAPAQGQGSSPRDAITRPKVRSPILRSLRRPSVVGRLAWGTMREILMPFP
jgi:hypothetical protein